MKKLNDEDGDVVIEHLNTNQLGVWGGMCCAAPSEPEFLNF
jgi:hypothetical protein